MRKKYEAMDKYDNNVELIRWLLEREPATEFYLPIKQVEGMAHNRLCYNSGAAYYMAYLPYTRNRRILSSLCPILTNFWKSFYASQPQRCCSVWQWVHGQVAQCDNVG